VAAVATVAAAAVAAAATVVAAAVAAVATVAAAAVAAAATVAAAVVVATAAVAAVVATTADPAHQPNTLQRASLRAGSLCFVRGTHVVMVAANK
jgi:hypothetical protein